MRLWFTSVILPSQRNMQSRQDVEYDAVSGGFAAQSLHIMRTSLFAD
jgi:hypothetical protein